MSPTPPSPEPPSEGPAFPGFKMGLGGAEYAAAAVEAASASPEHFRARMLVEHRVAEVPVPIVAEQFTEVLMMLARIESRLDRFVELRRARL